jgi:hypothetical protein
MHLADYEPPVRPDLTSEPPPALQLPAEVHDIDPIEDATKVKVLVGPEERICLAAPQVPFFSFTTNA